MIKNIALITVIIILFVFLYVKPQQYYWADRVLKSDDLRNWKLINYSSKRNLLEPWTLFKAPKTGLYFVEEAYMRLGEDVIAGQIMEKRYGENTRKYYEAFNCKDTTFVILSDYLSVDEFDPEQANWIKAPANTGAREYYDFYCDLLLKIKSLETLH